MSVQRYSIENYFPTEPWLEEYERALEANESLDQTGAGWGVGWEGAFIFQITDVPVDEHTVADLPGELVAGLNETFDELDDGEVESLLESAPEDVRSDVEARDGSLRERVREELLATTLVDAPDRVWSDVRDVAPDIFAQLLEQLEENLAEDRTVYAYLDVYDGGCREVDVVTSLDERDHGFVIIGAYDEWKKLVRGEGGVVNMMMAGELDVDGDMQKILQYSNAAIDLAETSAGVDSRFIF